MKIRSLWAVAGLICLAFSGPIFSKNPASFSSQKMEEYGTASYYADQFHGKKTANGERFNMNDMTAAHKSLPFGTLVRVTRLDNQKSITVRINDRGPYAKGYIIDLSKRAASELGIVQMGTAKVKLEIVGKDESRDPQTVPIAYEDEKPARPARAEIEVKRSEVKPILVEKPAKIEAKPAKKVEVAEKEDRAAAVFQKVTGSDFKEFDLYKIELTRPKKSGFGVQVMVLETADFVFKEVAKLQSSYDDILMNVEPDKAGKPVYKLVVGPFADKKKAEAAQKALKKKGYKGFIVALK